MAAEPVELPARWPIRSAPVNCNGVTHSAARIRTRSHCVLPCLLTSTAPSCPAHAANTCAWRAGINYSPRTKQHAVSRHLSRLCSVHPPLHGHACKSTVRDHSNCSRVPRVLYVSECAHGSSTCHVSCAHARLYVRTYVCMYKCTGGHVPCDGLLMPAEDLHTFLQLHSTAPDRCTSAAHR